MSGPERLFKDSDLMVDFMLTGQPDFVPPKALDAEEILRRQELVPGQLVAEQQLEGLAGAARLLEAVEEPVDVGHVAAHLAVAGLGTAWYNFGRDPVRRHGDDVNRRRLKLPMLATGDPDRTPTLDGLQQEAASGLRNGVALASLALNALKFAPKKVELAQKHLGRSVGNTSLALACLAIPETSALRTSMATDSQAQRFARRRAQWAMRTARDWARSTGMNPSLAQLTDPDSPLAVAYRRTAPTAQAREAYELAFAG